MDDYYDSCNFDDDEFLSDESDSSELISSSDDEDTETNSNLNTIYEDDENEEGKEDVDKCSEKKKKSKYTGVPFLTKFEKTRVLGVRTEQILAGSRIFVKTSSTDPYEIACEELYAKRMPLIIRRYLGTKCVDISVNNLAIL